jgi:hypothetical protein
VLNPGNHPILTNAPYTISGNIIKVTNPDGSTSEGPITVNGDKLTGPDGQGGTITFTKVTSDTSKPDPVPGGDTITVTNEQVYQRSDDGVVGGTYNGSGTVKMGYSVKKSDRVYVEIGKITGGRLSFTLPATASEQYLYPILEDMPSGITVSPSDARLAIVDFYFFDDSNREIGYLSFGETYHQVGYLYFDREVTMNGTGIGTNGDGSPFSQTWSINARKGWNKAYVVYAVSPPWGSTVTTDLSKVPSGLKWVFQQSYGSGGQSGGDSEAGEGAEVVAPPVID